MQLHFFKLISGENVFGEVEAGLEGQILIKKPYTAIQGNVMPYMIMDLGTAPGAIQIHPMNIIWSVPLDEFPQAEKIYKEAMGGIVTETPKESLIL